ncbi:hypothetical protein HDV02_006511 [Globomyces sp. JEL0801]|nr:hypothetical protein HDV02_006511 [Globomyces sp. JEL0801]
MPSYPPSYYATFNSKNAVYFPKDENIIPEDLKSVSQLNLPLASYPTVTSLTPSSLSSSRNSLSNAWRSLKDLSAKVFNRESE